MVLDVRLFIVSELYSQSITRIITMEPGKEAPTVVLTERPLRKQSSGLFLGRGCLRRVQLREIHSDLYLLLCSISWPRMFDTHRRRDKGGVLMFHQYRLAASLPPCVPKNKSESFTNK